MIKAMITILKLRVLFITLLFGAFGGALSLLLKVEDMKGYYPSLAALIALAVSLLISFLIKGKWNLRFRNQLKVTSVVLFLLFLAAAAIHTNYVINKTFEYQEFDQTNRYVKGDYSALGLQKKKEFPMLDDVQLLYQKMDGTDGIDTLWTKDSINHNIFLLIISYCAVVLSLVACVSLLTEILASSRYNPAKKKPRAAGAVTS